MIAQVAAIEEQGEPDQRTIGRLLAVVIGLAVLWNLVGNLWLPGGWYVPANLAVATVLIAIARRSGMSWVMLGLGRAHAVRGFVVGLAAAAAVAVVVGVALLSAESLFAADDVLADSTTDHWFVPLVRIPLGTAVLEEVLFRSVLLGALLRRGSTRSAVVWSSVVFGAWHIVPAWETADGSAIAVAAAIVGTVAITSVAGVGFALLRLWGRNVIAPTIAHTATNSFAYAAALVSLDLI